jgi:hypothetical protein
VSAERDELRELVDTLPEDRVPAALADVKRHLAVLPDVTWPPEFFGMGPGSRHDLAQHHDDVLAEGFGR